MDPLVRIWWLWSIVGAGIVVVVVAVLLGLIIAAAKSIDQHARRIWIVGKQIAGNTASIWMLDAVKSKLVRTEGAVKALDRSASSINETLQAMARKG